MIGIGDGYAIHEHLTGNEGGSGNTNRPSTTVPFAQGVVGSQPRTEPGSRHRAQKAARKLCRALILGVAHLHFGRHDCQDFYYFGFLARVDLALAIHIRRGISARLSAGS
jgi:hypothetical protein